MNTKKTATQMYDRVRKSCSDTPFKEIQMGDNLIRLYWTIRRGSMGFQVWAVVHKWNDSEKTYDMGLYKTTGCGFCKESEAYKQSCLFLGVKASDDTLGAGPISHKHHVGGNYYKVAKHNLRKI